MLLEEIAESFALCLFDFPERVGNLLASTDLIQVGKLVIKPGGSDF